MSHMALCTSGSSHRWGREGRSAPFLSEEQQRSNSCCNGQTSHTMAGTAVAALTPTWLRKKKDEWPSQSGLWSPWLVSGDDASLTHVQCCRDMGGVLSPTLCLQSPVGECLILEMCINLFYLLYYGYLIETHTNFSKSCKY